MVKVINKKIIQLPEMNTQQVLTIGELDSERVTKTIHYISELKNKGREEFLKILGPVRNRVLAFLRLAKAMIRVFAPVSGVTMPRRWRMTW